MLCFLEILEEATINDQTLEGCFVVEFYIEVCHSHSQLIMNWQNVANLTTWNGERITANEEGMQKQPTLTSFRAENSEFYSLIIC